MSRLLTSLSALAAAAALASAADAAPKKPPACAAISFRPVEGTLSEGEMPAGHYRSRFGTLDLRARVQGGQVGTYFLQVNGKPLQPLAGEIPKSSYDCLASKNVGTPPRKREGACTGNRFRVVIDSSGERKLLMLFGLQGNDWLLCEAGTPPA